MAVGASCRVGWIAAVPYLPGLDNGSGVEEVTDTGRRVAISRGGAWAARGWSEDCGVRAGAVEMAARCREQDVEIMQLDVISSHQGFCDRITKKIG
jgi:hypothetical protein